MNFLERLFIKLHNLVSRRDEESRLSAGFFPPKIREAVEKLCIDKSGSLLDLGCGEGLFLVSLAKSCPHLNITGVDNYEQILEESHNRIKQAEIKNVKIMLADAKFLPFQDSYFDTVVCLNMLYNLSSKEEMTIVLREMIRVCKMQGSLIFDIRNKFNPLIYFGYKFRSYYDTSSSWSVNPYGLKEIVEILKREGFGISQKVGIGFPSIVAPVIIIEARSIAFKEKKGQ